MEENKNRAAPRARINVEGKRANRAIGMTATIPNPSRSRSLLRIAKEARIGSSDSRAAPAESRRSRALKFDAPPWDVRTFQRRRNGRSIVCYNEAR